MLLDSPTAFFEALSPGTRIAGLDLGSKTIGLALSDSSHTIATPSRTIKRKKLSIDLPELLRWMEQEKVGGIVIGLPRNMDGSEGPRSQATRQFIYDMEQHIDLPVLLWDERMSTVAVTRSMLEADMSRQKRAKAVDHLAAGFILQGALDAIKFSRK